MSLIDGRGRWYRRNTRRTVDDYLRLNAHQIMAAGDFAGGFRCTVNWPGRDQAAIDVAVTPHHRALLTYNWRGQLLPAYYVTVATTAPHYGGVRYWWLCPNCGRRVADLYGGKYFWCRTCHGLTYRTAQAGSADIDPSVKNRLRVLRRRLAITEKDRALRPPKPNGMHRATHDRLAKEYVALVEVSEQVWLAKLYALTGLRQRTAQADARAAWRRARRGQRIGGGLYDAMLEWVMTTDNPIIADSRENRERERAAQEAAQETPIPWAALERYFQTRPDPNRLTLGDLAKLAGVPYAFAVEAQAEGLLRPDGGRNTRTRRYRRRLASWLGKLQRLRAEGHSWADLRAWASRRWQPGHEAERQTPAPAAGIL